MAPSNKSRAKSPPPAPTPAEPAKATRFIHVKFLTSPAEKQMLDELAEATGMTVSDFLRQNIRRMHVEMQDVPRTTVL
jgi:hypothetical protein